jgi:hypothetical protein
MKQIYQSHLLESNRSSQIKGVLPPTQAVAEGGEALLYHSNHNSDKKSEIKEKKEEKKKKFKPTNIQAKTFKALDGNCKYWMKTISPERVGVLTLTFADHVTCMKEGQRRWNNLNRLITREKKFIKLYKTAEAQKSGRLHYHIIIETTASIKGNIDWDIYEQMGEAKTTAEKKKLGHQLGKTATPHLNELWTWLRAKCKATGFGRSELMPMKKPEHLKNYIGKYLQKDMEDNSLKKDGKNKNMRISTYGRKCVKVANTQFSWALGPASVFRRRLAIWAEERGFKDTDQIKEIYGSAWCHNLRKQIMDDETLGMYLDKKWNELQNPDKINKSLYPWKAQILSGAFSEDSKDYAMNEYLKDYKKEDKRIGTRSPSDENKHFQIYKSQKLYKERYESWII